ALAAAQTAVAADPEFAEAYGNLGIRYGQRGRFEHSERAFAKALALEPGNLQYLANLATTYQRARKLDEAIDLYRKTRALDPRAPVYAINLGNTYLQKGMVLEAIAEFQRAVELQPTNPVAQRKLAEAHARLGKRRAQRRLDGWGALRGPPCLLSVRVEAAAGFAAELAGHHHSLEQRRRRVAGFAEFLEHHLGDVQRSVEAHQIEQGERSHRIAAAELHRRIDVLERREPALVDTDRVEPVGHEETVDDERGRVLGLYRRLAHRAHPLGGGLHRVVAAQDRAHDLDELHERDRVEEVQAEDLGRPPGRR